MKVCCEEMQEWLKTVGDSYGVKLMKEGKEPAELLIETAKSLPNLIFRFCPYCGASQAELKDTGISFLDDLKAKLFPKELDEKTSLSCRTVLLEETLQGLQEFFKNEAPKFAKKIQQ